MAPKRHLASLDQLAPGSSGIVRRLGGGKELASRLAAMGLSIGSLVKVLQNPGHGPLLVLVRDTRIALGRGEAPKVLVEEADGA
ncbi:MAG: ferrous iron transport protein A [Deinococcus sp.]|nr:ferrous iron transport protein A [Deinococcus sp.]